MNISYTYLRTGENHTQVESKKDGNSRRLLKKTEIRTILEINNLLKTEENKKNIAFAE